MKLTSVSIDLDEIHHYFAIHGLDGASAAHVGYDVALGRAVDFAATRAIPLTLFAVGEDLGRPKSAEALAAAAARGHAVENHSQHHLYDLTRRPRAEMAREVEEGAAAIAAVTGERPGGFRAPGYTVNDELFDVLEEAGVAFDSSVFPCPSYYLAKAAALASMRVVGRRSRSILDAPSVLAAPRRAYRPGRTWHQRGGRRFLELPIQVTPRLRLPFFGTSIGLGGPRVATALARACADEPFVNLELHLMDFLDASDGLDALVPHQPELRVPLATRFDALEAALDELGARGHGFVTLAEAVASLQ